MVTLLRLQWSLKAHFCPMGTRLGGPAPPFFECTTGRTKDALCLHFSHFSGLWAFAVLLLRVPTDELCRSPLAVP